MRERLVEAREKFVEGRGETTEFVARVAERQTLVQILCADAARALRHRDDGGEASACEEPTAERGDQQPARHGDVEQVAYRPQPVLDQVERLVDDDGVRRAVPVDVDSLGGDAAADLRAADALRFGLKVNVSVGESALGGEARVDAALRGLLC